VKRLIGALIAAALPTIAAAQGPRDVTQIPLAINYDLDSATFVYPVSQGILITTPGATARAEGVLSTIPGAAQARIATSGASTTVAALTAGTNPFSAVQVGDFIRARTVSNPRPDVRDAVEGQQSPWLLVVARASADSITVNQTVNFTGGVAWEWRRAYVGGNTGYGWVPVRGFDRVRFTLLPTTVTTDSNGISFRIECRDDMPGIDTNSPAVVYPFTPIDESNTPLFAPRCDGTYLYNAAAADQSCTAPDATLAATGEIGVSFDTEGWYECRLGLRIHTADDGADAVVESISAYFVGVSK
jgi:hypothetical protein